MFNSIATLGVLASTFACVSFVIIFFFFQAEDGIRDYKVTGVQTCALPISLKAGITAGRVSYDPSKAQACLDWVRTQEVCGNYNQTGSPCENLFVPHVANRSEERRVGKECRSRWSPYH